MGVSARLGRSPWAAEAKRVLVDHPGKGKRAARRDSTATRLVLAGTNHKLVMDYMGHKSLATTNRYVHLNANAKAQVARQVFLGGKA